MLRCQPVIAEIDRRLSGMTDLRRQFCVTAKTAQHVSATVQIQDGVVCPYACAVNVVQAWAECFDAKARRRLQAQR